MAFASHKGTVGHTIATDILSDSKKTAGKPTSSDPAAGGGFHTISIDKASNGLTIRHTPPLPKGVKEYSDKAPESQTHVFTSPEEAHEHLGRLLGADRPKG